MDFNLTEEHLMIQQAAKDFAVAELPELLNVMNIQNFQLSR
jgi:hypothetical protein